jgi:putative phosphoribosyl transferase
VLGLPRGGMPVAFEVAEALRAPLDVLVVRKLGVPFQPELAFGAIGEGGARVINDSVVREADLSSDDIDAIEGEQRVELERRVERFRGGRDPISLAGRVAVLVDDGIATGATARTACQVARAQGASRVVSAVPIGPDDIVERFAGYADEVVCLETPAFFFAVGQGIAPSPRPPTTRSSHCWLGLGTVFEVSPARVPPTRRCAMRRSK